MSTYNVYHHKEQYVDAFSEWVEKIEPNAFVTLTFKIDVSQEDAQACMKQFILHLSRACFSKKQFKRGEKIKIFPFLEKTKVDRFHYHLLLKIPPKYTNRVGAFKDRIRKYWLRVRAKNKNYYPVCGGNPYLLDKAENKWFIYEPMGFPPHVCKDLVRYLLKQLYFNNYGSLENMCVDAENINM